MSYDDWKLATPPEYDEDPRDDTRCPHGEDRPDDCEACNDVDLDDQPDDTDECTCSLGPFDRSESLGFPCDSCGRIVR